MMTFRALIAASILAVAVAFAPVAHAQTTVSEDFTGATTTNPWFFFMGACLTAGSSTSTASPGTTVPGCASVFTNYYSPAGDTYLVGGAFGYLGTNTAGLTPDPVGSGALRFTNGSLSNGNGGYMYGFNERGAIVSASAPFPTGSGVQITFKTVTYMGNKGGTGDGADGISFYLLDGCMPITGGSSAIPGSTVPSTCTTSSIYGTGQTFPAIGAFGGSLAYSCSNSNNPHDGLAGAYLGLGIDEYGNFLNGWVNTLNEVGSSGTSGGSSFNDNTASGGLYQAGRIGLRGAGSVSWQALNTAYGTSTGSSSPYYPSSLATYCSTGTNTGSQCASCAFGPFIPSTGLCTGNYSCSTGTPVGTSCESCAAGTLNPATGQCNNVCTTGTYETDGQFPSSCYICSNGASFLHHHNKSDTYTCDSGGTLSDAAVTSVAATTTAATLGNTTPTLGSSTDLRQSAVQNTCQTGNLYNYSNPASPVSVGPAVYGASYNPAGILDYTAIGSTVNSSAQGYNVLTNQIASETSTTRGATTTNPIAYSLKITQDGLLSLSYSYNGGAAVPVIASQSITANNGPLPQSFRFGFAGSSGGSTNVHEILCFKAAPVQTSSGSGGVNVFQDPTLKTGAELFLASYFPSDWTGSVTATPIYFNSATNSLALATAPLWDGSCVLTGGACATTGVAVGAAEAPTSRVMITWNGTTGIPFEWPTSVGSAGLSAAQQAALDFGDTTQTADRLNYLRGDRTNEINSNGVGEFRARDRVLGDVIDSSPAWIGPPGEPYVSMTSWVDKIYPSSTPAENSGQTYLTYQQSKQGRTNVVYVGGNDGFLHGFRAGKLDSSGNLVTTTPNINDGHEVLAYMPGAVVNTIHPTTTTGGVTTVNTALDYSNTQYSHAYFVDATPATGDLFYNGTWHTWVVGGLGGGGAAIYALDVTDPTQFAEANAASLVIGEWTPSNLTCANDTSLPLPCKNYLGKTYGTPEIRRFHNGQWGVIFGNGYNNVDSNGNTGAAGIYIMLIGSATGAPTTTLYYLPATASSSGGLRNGIGSPTSLDIDLDHVIDYIYAGDLLGHVWKFDVTSQTPSNWGKTPSSPLFTAPNTPRVAAVGTTPAIPAEPSPITTRLQVGTLKSFGSTTTAGGVVISNAPERVIINFGTGQQIPQTTTAAAQYANGPQYLYGIWDWDFGAPSTAGGALPTGSWNALSPNQQAVALSGSQTIVAPGSGTNLQVQTITTSTIGTGNNATGVRTVSHNAVCWKGDTACGGGSSQTQFGWYIQLPGTDEQVIFDPTYSPDGEFVVSTFIPAVNSVLSCTVATATGFSMGLDPLTGGGSPTPFFNVGGTSFDGVQLNGTGTPSFLSSGQASDNNAEYMLTQTSSGTPAAPQQVNRNAIVTGQRLNWIQRR
jgi:type IV pilus assembly protein PilY1